MNNRVVVITGATGSLGQVAAHAFAEQGVSLVLISTRKEKLDALADDLNLPADKVLTRSVDLLDADAVQDAAEVVSAKFGRVDFLIHLIGGWVGGKTIAETDAEDFKFMLDQHAWSTFFCCAPFRPNWLPMAGNV